MEEILNEIKKLISEELEIDKTKIPDNAELNKFPKWDSLNHIKIILALEEKFDVEVSEESIQQLVSIDEIIKYLKDRK